MANLNQAWNDAILNQYLEDGGPFDDPAVGMRRLRMVIRNTHRFLESQQPKKLPVLRSHTTPPRTFSRPDTWPADQSYRIPPLSLIRRAPGDGGLGLREVANIEQQDPDTLLYAEWQGNFRQYGSTIDLNAVIAPDGDPVTLRFTGLPSLLDLPELDQITVVDDLKLITDVELPILALEAEVYQLALEYHILEFLKDDRAPGLYQELVSTIDNKRPGLQVVRIISTTPTETAETTAASLVAGT